MDTPRPHLGWHSRDSLPHFDQPDLVQAITFRLADSLPAEVLQQWEVEHRKLGENRRDLERRRRIEQYLDAGHGACWPGQPEIAQVVETALLHFDGARYRLLGWVVMPNHVHVLAEMLPGFPLGDVMYSWKAFTAKEANKILGRSGPFWQREYHDRYIRDGDHFAKAMRYLEDNPVKAGLCAAPEDWPWGSARRRAELPPPSIQSVL